MNSVSYGPHVGCVLLGGMGVDGNCCDDFAWHLNLNEMEWTKVRISLSHMCNNCYLQIPWCSDEFKRTWHKTCTFSSGPGYFEFYVFGGSPDNIWKPHSEDLGGPAFTSFGKLTDFNILFTINLIYRSKEFVFIGDEGRMQIRG